MSYCIVFRTGGTENYQWHRSLAMSYTEAEIALIVVSRMGYKAMLADYKHSKLIGLPEGYEYK